MPVTDMAAICILDAGNNGIIVKTDHVLGTSEHPDGRRWRSSEPVGASSIELARAINKPKQAFAARRLIREARGENRRDAAPLRLGATPSAATEAVSAGKQEN